MRLICTQDYDARDTRLNVNFSVRDGHYARLFEREFTIQTKAELLATLDLLRVSLVSSFAEVEEVPESDEAEATL